MKMRVLSVFAAVAFLAACSSDADQKAATSGTGQAAAPAAPAAPSTIPMVAPGSVDEFVKNVGDRVYFDFDKYEVKPEARAQLDRQVDWFKRYPQWKITVEGHCDERGTREYNIALGERRANAVKEYLVAKGVATARIKTISYGKERPAAIGSNEAAWAQNRRGVSVPTN
ncbi:MAG: peptidoglycan-associated lipoprotein Pal [Rhodospirillales bacterium]|nr:peptidoglycan-associated lipoprotein Pal [Rhodospirillales bacterium]